VRLEKCALCGAQAEVVSKCWAGCPTNRCPVPGVGYGYTLDHWNRLQRAIRKSAPAGRVLARGWAVERHLRNHHRPDYTIICHTACKFRGTLAGCKGCRRVEVREAKAGGR